MMKTSKVFGTLTLSALFLTGVGGAALAEDRSASQAVKTVEAMARRVERPETETPRGRTRPSVGRTRPAAGRSVKIKRLGALTHLSGNLNLKRLIENLRSAV